MTDQMVKLTDGDYLCTLESKVSFGLLVLLGGSGEALEASLDPLPLFETFAACFMLNRGSSSHTETTLAP